jgi:hypothetical protein
MDLTAETSNLGMTPNFRRMFLLSLAAFLRFLGAFHETHLVHDLIRNVTLRSVLLFQFLL